MINPALSPLHREFHQTNMEKGILIAVLSTFPKTLTFPLPPIIAFFSLLPFLVKRRGVSLESGRPPTLGVHAHTHTATERELVSDGR